MRALCEKVAGASNQRFLTTEWAAKIILELKARRHKKLERRARAEKILLHSLSPRQREILRKECPFRGARDQVIRILNGEGAP